jgi:hypothetical protein
MMAEDEIDLLLRDVPPSSSGGARPKLRAPAAPPRRQTDEIDDLLDSVADASPAAPPPRGVIPGVAAPPPPLRRAAAPAAAPAVGVDPRLDSFVNDVIGEASRRTGYTYKLGEGVRTPAQQAQKVAQGVSWTYNSRHLHGRGRDVLAFDERGNYIRDGAHPAYTTLGEVYGERSAAAPAPVKWGVVRGGRQVDPGHFELGETDAIDSLLADIPDAAAVTGGDEIDALLATVPDASDDPVEVVNSVPASRAVAMESVSPTPSAPETLNPYSSDDRARRDTAASTRVRAVTVPLTRSLADYEDSRSLMADAYREGARSLNIPSAYVEEWIKSHPGDMRVIGDVNAPDATPADLLGSSVHDARNNTVRLELGGLSQLENDYKAQRSTVSRAADFINDPSHTAGEKALEVAAPVASAAGRAGDLATRPLSATSTAFWSLARKHSPTEAVDDAWSEFRTGETAPGAGNYLAEKVAQSETLKNINPNLPALAGGVVEMLTDPANAVPLGVLARGAGFARSLKGVRAVEEALLASRDARALEFFNSGGRVLKLENEGARGVFVTLKDAEGLEHRIDLSAMYAGGGKPKLKSVPAGRELEGVGVERMAETGRVYHNGRPQDFIVEPGGSLRASPVGGGGDTARRAAAAAPVEQALPLAAPLTPRERAKKLWRDTQDVINISKAIPASFDNSALFGQGAIIAGARPSLIAGAVSDSARSAMSRRAFEAFKKRLVTHPNQDLRESSELYLGSIKQGEETFGSRFAERIPGVAASQRAYEATLDSLRSNAFDLYAERLTKAGVTDPKAFKDIARWVNISSGRGELGRLEPLADVLNLPMFSPRLLASKFNVISPVRYARMHPAARKIALTEMFRATGSLSVTMGLSRLAGASVDLNPFSAGFGTIDADGTSYDLSGGRLRTFRTIAQIADSINKEHRGERVREDRRPRALVEKFFRAYLSPVGQLAVDAYTGENMRGEEFTGDWRELDRLIPFAVKDMREAYRAAGAVGAVKALPAFVGVGVHTMEKQSEPLMPTLSEPVQDELSRLGLDLEHLGKKQKTSIAVRPRRTVAGVTGDSIEPFGDERRNSGMGISLEETAAQLSAELEAVLNEEMNSPDYAAMSDDDRAQRLDLLLINTEKRVFNAVRRDARGLQMDEEKKVRERQERMSAPTRGRMRFKL